jgi:hypothetical protein
MESAGGVLDRLSPEAWSCKGAGFLLRGRKNFSNLSRFLSNLSIPVAIASLGC